MKTWTWGPENLLPRGARLLVSDQFGSLPPVSARHVPAPKNLHAKSPRDVHPQSSTASQSSAAQGAPQIHQEGLEMLHWTTAAQNFIPQASMMPARGIWSLFAKNVF